MSAQTNDNGVMKAILESANASNALAIANTFYVDVMKKMNNSLEALRQAQSFAMTTVINFGYKIANTILMQSLVEASITLGSAVGQFTTLRGANNEQNSFNALQQKEAPKLNVLKDKEKELNASLKIETDKSKITKLNQDLKTNKQEQDEITKRLEEKDKKVNQKYSKANQISNMLQAFTQGANALPQGYRDTIRTVGENIQAIIQQLQSMLSSSYDKVAQTLKGFLDTDYLSGLVAIGSMQLR